MPLSTLCGSCAKLSVVLCGARTFQIYGRLLRQARGEYLPLGVKFCQQNIMEVDRKKFVSQSTPNITIMT